MKAVAALKKLVTAPLLVPVLAPAKAKKVIN